MLRRTALAVGRLGTKENISADGATVGNCEEYKSRDRLYFTGYNARLRVFARPERTSEPFQYFLTFLARASISSLMLAIKSALPLVGFQPRALDLLDRARLFVPKAVVFPYHRGSDKSSTATLLRSVTHK
jgi:hypothetical protein